MSSSDLLTTIGQLDPHQLREQLVQLDRQRSALVVLLRAATAAARKGTRPQTISRPTGRSQGADRA